MKDSGFKTSGIRQLLINVTGIDVLEIESIEDNLTEHIDNQFIIIHFLSTSHPGSKYQMTISNHEFNSLCESDLNVFKVYFDKFISEANKI